MFSSSASVPYWRLSSFYFFYFALVGAWMPFWPLYLQENGFNAADIGYLAGILMATKIVAPNIWGWLADKTGRRMSIIRAGSLIALVIFLGLFWNIDSFWWMAIIIAGYSFFWNAVLAQFEVVTLSHLGTRYQRYSQIRVWGSIGFIIAVTLLGYSFDYLSISWLPWVIVFLLLGIWLSSLTVNEKEPLQTSDSERRSLKSVLKQPAVIAFLIACFLLQVSHGPYYTFFSVYLEDHGYSRTVTGLLWSLGVLAEVVVFIVMHKLLQRFSLRQIMFTSLILAVIRWLLLGFYVDDWLIVIIAQLMHAATFGSYHAFAVEMVRRFFTGGLEGQGMAMYSGLSFGAGGAVGAVLSGWVWEISPQITFVAAAVACVLATLVSCWVTEHSRVDYNPPSPLH
ncbi:MFS transporter [Oceanicoccus sagamiensis]|uniref:MFS transporter n=1 Tax=Oceanicoccus sagamiensis TaxID=716816 RepID=A0A1X9NDJ6_9GAMM|nr:MFS transporter [Oceanicoccus sagamiensis]ARN76110.1 MFS transporter [Oceanicoccus sagamiensis]